MNIGFDAKRAFHNHAGLGNYSRLIIQSFISLYPEHYYHLFTPSATSRFQTNGKNVLIHSPSSFKNKILSSQWRRRNIIHDLEKNQIDIYHGLSNEIPARAYSHKIQSVVTIHDLIFEKYPNYYFWWDRKIYHHKSFQAAKEANRIIAISRQTKKDLIDYYGINPEKISVIYPIISSIFFSKSDEKQLIKARNKLNLPARYLLYVGTIEERKNLLTLVKAMHILKESVGLMLVVVGKPLTYKKEVVHYIEKNNLRHRVIFLEKVSNEILRNIYKLASAFIYPSFYEGFGMPVTEALACGVPVIASDIPVLHEAGGESPYYVDCSDEDQLASVIVKVLEDEKLRTEMIEKGYRHASLFRYDLIAQQLMALYKQLLSM